MLITKPARIPEESMPMFCCRAPTEGSWYTRGFCWVGRPSGSHHMSDGKLLLGLKVVSCMTWLGEMPSRTWARTSKPRPCRITALRFQRNKQAVAADCLQAGAICYSNGMILSLYSLLALCGKCTHTVGENTMQQAQLSTAQHRMGANVNQTEM